MNCKPGDLAIMVSSGIPENIGRIFEILNFNQAVTDFSGKPIWNVRAAHPARTADGEMSSEGNASDADLRPITGLPITDDIKDEVTA